MKILVLGSDGQIGRPFCEYAISKGHSIIPIDKKRGLHDDLAYYSSSKYLDNCISDSDVIVFLACNVGGSKYLEAVDKSFSFISENVKILDNTFNRLYFSGKPILFASSQMANMLDTNYGMIKNLGERYSRATNNCYICRFWNVYGYEEPKDPKSHVITDFIFKARTTGVIDMLTDGNETRQFLHTDDCSRALLHWCENHTEYDRSEYIDITSFKWNSIKEVADIVSNLTGAKVLLGLKKDNIQSGVKNIPSDYVLNFWKPTITLEEGIKKLL